MKVTRKCSECGKEVTYEQGPFRSDLFFCSEKCNNLFFNRNLKKREEMGLSPLLDEQGKSLKAEDFKVDKTK